MHVCAAHTEHFDMRSHHIDLRVSVKVFHLRTHACMNVHTEANTDQIEETKHEPKTEITSLIARGSSIYVIPHMPITIASTRDKVQMRFSTGTDLGPQSVWQRDIVGVHTSHKSFRQ